MNAKDLQMHRERQKDLQREAQRERLAREAQRREPKSRRTTSPLWARLWSLF
jgi:hypothetical protein